MTSSNGNIFCVTGHLCGEFTGKRPVTRGFDAFFDLHPNKRLSKQWWGWWFETLSSQLWRHCNVQPVVSSSDPFGIITKVVLWIVNHIHCIMWYTSTHVFPSFKTAVEVRTWRSNYISNSFTWMWLFSFSAGLGMCLSHYYVYMVLGWCLLRTMPTHWYK